MEKSYLIFEQLLTGEQNLVVRSGPAYQMFVFPEGICRVRIFEKSYQCTTSELVLMKPQQTITIENISEKEPCHFLRLSISGNLLEKLSDETFSFTEKFSYVPYQAAVIHSEARQCAMLHNLLFRIQNPDPEGITLGQELYCKSLLTSFLILFLRACVESDRVYRKHQKKELLMDDIFRYISHHLADDLSLHTLEKEFFVSGEHLSRKFHQSSGMTLHDYIIRSRVDLSKKYLMQGYAVKDIYEQCGFENYSHFFRVFKKETGMTPMEYYKSLG